MKKILFIWIFVLFIINITDPTFSFPDSDFKDWRYSQNVTIYNNYSVNWDNGIIRMNLFTILDGFDENNFNSDASDIRIVSDTGENLSVCIDWWNPTISNGFKPSVVWTNLSIDANSNRKIRFYFGNDNAQYNEDCSFFITYENFTNGEPDGWTHSGSHSYFLSLEGNPEYLFPKYAVIYYGGSDNNKIHPPVPPDVNYSYEVYYLLTDVDTDNVYSFDGGSTFINVQKPSDGDYHPAITGGCLDGDNIISMNSTTIGSWIRIRIVRDRLTYGMTGEMWYNETDTYKKCNSTNSAFASSQSRLSWSFAGGNGGSGGGIFENFKLWRNFGYNTSEPWFESASLEDYSPPKVEDFGCTSCIPYQDMNNQPFKSIDETPTINATIDETATCAIVANETNPGNYNYTDIIADYGGVECTTTGSPNQICTVQSSDALSIGDNQWISVGCKDGSSNELSNATFVASVNITDGISPKTFFINSSDIGTFKLVNHNDTIKLNFNATDNHYSQFQLDIYKNSSLIYSNLTYDNGTAQSITNTLGFGDWRFNITANDPAGNYNWSTFDVSAVYLPNANVVYGNSSVSRLKFTVKSLLDKLLPSDSQNEIYPSFNVTNNGTKNGTSVLIYLNQSLALGYTLFCGNNNTNFYNTTTLNTTPKLWYNGSIPINFTTYWWCWLNLSLPHSGTSLNVKFDIPS